MYQFLNLFLQTFKILSILLFFFGILLSFFGYRILNIFSIIFSIIIGFFLGSLIGIFQFKSNTMAFIFGTILSTTFSFFTFIYYKYIKNIFISILITLFLIYLPFFILFEIFPFEIFQTKLYIYINLMIILSFFILSCKFTNTITIITTSLTGSIMFLHSIYNIFNISINIFLKIISILILFTISILFQFYNFKKFNKNIKKKNLQ